MLPLPLIVAFSGAGSLSRALSEVVVGGCLYKFGIALFPTRLLSICPADGVVLVFMDAGPVRAGPGADVRRYPRFALQSARVVMIAVSGLVIGTSFYLQPGRADTTVRVLAVSLNL